MKRTSTTLVFLTLLFALAISAQAQMQTPKPGPEHKKLDYFVGTWSTDGDIKPGPMGPGGKMSGTSHVEWMDGGFFMVMHSDMKGPMGNATGTAFMGYNSDEKKYTYNEFNSMGQADAAMGTVDGDTWNWTSDEKMGGMSFKGRYTMKILSPTSYTFKFEMSQDGSTWSTVMDGKATKTK
jgi:hypothetical protein